MSKSLISEKLKILIDSLDRDIDVDRRFILKRPPGPKPNPIEPIIFSEELKYLNSCWGDWSSPTVFTSHRPVVGGIFSKIKQKLQGYLFNVIFRDYFERERQFIIRQVQFNNLTAKYIDSQNEKIFWDLVKKLDREIENVNERYDTLLSELAKNFESRLQ